MKRLLAAAALTAAMAITGACTSTEELARDFATPPETVQTGIYWYWISGNISEEGVVRDLHAMKRAGINRAFNAGDLMLIRDHMLMFFPANPLIGANIAELGVRFPDMSHIYDPSLCDIISASAAENGIALREGVYCQLTGPSYESPAEIRALGILGADAVGMSTACEAVAANHCGLRVCGVSCISNKAAGISPTPLSHAEVQQAADEAAPRFTALVRSSIAKMK